MIVNVVYGFLGAGKTTFIRYMMENPPQSEKVVIIVNEFGEVGIDGLVLSGHGAQVAEVIELPSGCICCTIASDFRRQLLDLCHRFAPDRIIVEPTGVATISQIMQILESEDMRPLYSDLNLIHLLDASEFLSFIKSHRHFMENQIRRSRAVLLNKMDRVKPAMLDLLVSSIKEINPNAIVYPTRFARLQDSVLKKLLGSAGDRDEVTEFLQEFEGTFVSEGAHGHDHGLADQFESFGRKYSDSFSRPCLVSFFEALRSGGYGKVVRAKGIFQTPEDWIKVELASGEVHVEAAPIAEYSALSIIGQEMKPQAMDAALDECREE
ncbi:CobW family GTP-binding protein [Desulfomonile tiedjei]|uniref:Putative GTPase, G3E family n=1 Tax=Desulfomonile tiedjei (strain ATCC 49306 / DSM 6799 / DCB-1) TaxID=706587 RepID=I4C594_DESTA|nr:GTP-binding protein [Desulfomonile tiedjei]AFM24735.1 putative GTPase, G3E family [Desulfomonile tiedjei DSM 6799]